MGGEEIQDTRRASSADTRYKISNRVGARLIHILYLVSYRIIAIYFLLISRQYAAAACSVLLGAGS